MCKNPVGDGANLVTTLMIDKLTFYNLLVAETSGSAAPPAKGNRNMTRSSASSQEGARLIDSPAPLA
jgi:hypothetical protein